MYAIITELNGESRTVVNEIWHKLKEDCGLEGIFNFPIPHFTWFAAEELDTEKSAAVLHQIAQISQPMHVRTFGLGIFSGEEPVLYLPIVKSMTLINFHKEIWEQLCPYAVEPKLYYSPSLWVPHITLALKDLNRENLVCALQSIGFQQWELSINIDNLSLVPHEDDQVGETLCCFQIGED